MELRIVIQVSPFYNFNAKLLNLYQNPIILSIFLFIFNSKSATQAHFILLTYACPTSFLPCVITFRHIPAPLHSR